MKRKISPKLTTVGVLFAGNRRVYTYTVPLKHSIKLGDEIVVDSVYGGPTIVFVVRIDKRPTPPQGWTVDTLKRVRARVVPL